MDPDEDFLEEVLGLVGVGDPAPDKAQEPAAVPVPQELQMIRAQETTSIL
jgi:hypothetical protein